MLDLAINHEEELRQLMRSIMFDDKFKFENYGSYYDDFKLDKTIAWNNIQCVSYDEEIGKVIGYMAVYIDRDAGKLTSLRIINFSNNKELFAADLKKFLLRLIQREDLNKISFSVIVGNPIENTYDKIIKKYGGRIVGIYEKDIKLNDGKIYDKKSYEIFTEEIRHRLRMRTWRKIEI